MPRPESSSRRVRSGVGRRSVGSHKVELALVRKPVHVTSRVRSEQRPHPHYLARIPAASLRVADPAQAEPG